MLLFRKEINQNPLCLSNKTGERTFFPQPAKNQGKFTPLTVAPGAVTCCCVTPERGQWTGRGLVQGEGTQGETKGGRTVVGRLLVNSNDLPLILLGQVGLDCQFCH